MADLTTQNIVAAGTKPTYATPTASTGDTAEVGNGKNTFLHVINANANPTTVTITVPGNTSYGEATPDPAITLADGSTTPTEAWIPLRKEYADADNAGVGRCTVTCSAVTDVDIAVVRMG